jgi:hypothetical protein
MKMVAMLLLMLSVQNAQADTTMSSLAPETSPRPVTRPVGACVGQGEATLCFDARGYLTPFDHIPHPETRSGHS